MRHGRIVESARRMKSSTRQHGYTRMLLDAIPKADETPAPATSIGARC